MVGLFIQPVNVQDAKAHNMKCLSMDAVDIEQAYQGGIDKLPECGFDVDALVLIRFGFEGDIVASLPVCSIHKNAFSLSLSEGVIIDLNSL